LCSKHSLSFSVQLCFSYTKNQSIVISVISFQTSEQNLLVAVNAAAAAAAVFSLLY
jgi:hypothetical protein